MAAGLSLGLGLAGSPSGMAADRQWLPSHVPEVVSHLTPLGRLPGTNQLRLAIGLPLRNEAALARLLGQLYDPASTNYHRYLAPEQFAEQFGPTERDYQAVKDFAARNGLTVTGTSANRLLLDVTGPAANIEKAFQVILRTYRHPTEARVFFAPDAEPSVDAGLAVADVSGLNNFSRPHPKLHKQKAAPAAGRTGSGSGGAYIGDDFRNAYAPGTTLTGAGQTVGLLQFDGFYSDDIAAYAAAAGGGRTNIAIQTVLLDGYDGVPTTGINSGSSEVSLDIEMAMAMAPGLSGIMLFEAGPEGVPNDVLNAMAASNTVMNLSCSWGWGGGPDTTTDNIFKQMAAQGQSFFDASGDTDAFTTGAHSVNGVDNTSLQNAPSSSPYIIQVGGTTLTMSGIGAAWSAETVWNWGGGTGSSGGISSYYSLPDWQTNISNLAGRGGSSGFRNIPDVALTADNVEVMYDDGSDDIFGGTSCAAPLWAGYTALMNQQAAANGQSPVGFINPAIYRIAAGSNYTSCFHDVTTGDNTWSDSPDLFYATNGYDLCTGLGTPAGQYLINLLAGAHESLNVTPAAGFAATGPAGGPFSGAPLNFTLTNSGTSTLTWSLINTSSWLNVAPAGGILAVAGQTHVTANLSSAAAGLAAGDHRASVWFTNLTSHYGQLRLFTLKVLPPLEISPAAGFTANGPAGGPFDVTAEDFLLTNLSTASLQWGVVNTSTWLTVSLAGGTLGAAGYTNLTASLGAGANSLAAGVYPANLLFTNQTGNNLVLPFELRVGQSLVQNGGFETGDFTGWTLLGSTNHNRVVFAKDLVHSGTYGAAFGEVGQPARLLQVLRTRPGTTYLLSVWLANPRPGGFGQFQATWGTNVVCQLTNPRFTAWTNLQWTVTATDTNTVLQFAVRKHPYFLGLDDVGATPIPTPAIKSTFRTPKAFNLVWNTTPGLVYQVQYKTNLFQPDWLNLGSSLSATNTLLTFSDTNNPDASPQRYYRLVESPRPGNPGR